MLEQSEEKKWIVVYVRKGRPFFLKIEAPDEQQAEDRAVQYLIETDQAGDCKILLTVAASPE